MAETALSDLVTEETAASFLAKMLVIAQALGLTTESWLSGDPDLTLFDAFSRIQETKEAGIVAICRAGFLDLASGDGLTLCARYLFNTERNAATYATCTLRFTNGGALPVTVDPEDVTVKNATTGATYRNTTGGTIAAGGTLDVTIEAETAGSDATSGVGDIDTMVTAIPSITCTNTTSAVGADAESDTALRGRAKAKLGALSPNGPSDAYAYVATTPELVSDAVVTRVRVVHDSTVGEVTVYLADDDGAVDAGTVTAVEAGLETWANPLCNSATVASASNSSLAVTYELWVYESISKTVSEIEDLVEAALLEGLRTRPIGGDIIPPATTGKIYKGWIEKTILGAVEPYGFRVSVTAPSGDTSLTNAQVATLGAVTVTAVHLVEDP